MKSNLRNYNYLICCLICIFISCKSKINKEKIASPVTKSKLASLKFSIFDSLNYYATNYEKIRVDIARPNSVLYISTVNNIRTGIIGFDDSIVTTYKQIGTVWRETSRSNFFNYLWDINEVDLNGDKFKDLRIMFPVMRGNYVCQVFLFDSSKKEFKHNRYYDLMNIGYDTKTNLVRSCGLGGIFDNSKELYHITGDSLTFYKGVDESISGTEKYGSSLDIYENNRGKKVLIKTIKGTANNISNRFEKMFWSDYLEYFDEDM